MSLQELPFPHEVKDLNPEIAEQLRKDFSGYDAGYVQVGQEKWFLPSGYRKGAPHYYNFEFRPDDIVIITFPRSGTTVTQEMIWLLCNDFDYQKASEIYLKDRFPFLEFSIFLHDDQKNDLLEDITDPEQIKIIERMHIPGWKKFENPTGRRFIKTHLPFDLLPSNITEVGCKIFYVARNPKDVAVSNYHMDRSFKHPGYTQDFPKYWNYFQNNYISWTPYWEHVKGGWTRRTEDNVLFLFYEDIIKDRKYTIQKVAGFLEKSCSTDEIEKLHDHLNFENFKKNESVNLEHERKLGLMVEHEADFVRRGISRGWTDYFDEELEQRADDWIEQNLKDTDLRFPV